MNSEIQEAVARIIRSGPFLRSRKLQHLLQYLVEETVSGRGENLKEYAIGVEIFDRPESFDPRLDSIVRVEARRLRTALDQYYVAEGANDPLVIELTKGSYIPSFHSRSAAEASPASTVPQANVVRSSKKLWIAGAVAVLAISGACLYWILRPVRFKLPQNATIGVLPFENLSGEAESEFFCFGLMDQITTELARTSGLRVVARTSASRFKRGDDVKAVARQLKVDALLEGSVRSSGGRVLVSAQLINAADSLHIWSQMYQRPTYDSLAAQDEIAQAIALEVRRTLHEDASKAVRQVYYSRNPEANLWYWKGSYLRSPMGTVNWRQNLLKSAEHYEQAVRIDGGFALAYSALADVYVSLGWERGGGAVTQEFMRRGRSAAEHALQLNENLAEAQGALGAVQFFFANDPASAEMSFQQAIRSDPNYGRARMWYAYALLMQRRFSEALTEAARARELDPLSYVATTHLAVVHYFSRRYDQALKLVNETLEVANTAPAHGLRGMILETQGKYAEAIEEYGKGLKIAPNHSYIKGMLGHAYGMSGREEDAKRLLGDAGLDFEKGGLSDLKIAYIHTALGNRDLALQHLEKDYAQRDPELPYINVDPVFDPVRNDPRFTSLLRKMKLLPQ